MINYVDKGVCAPKGFQASGVHAGFRKGKAKKDLAIIVSDAECNAAAVYTKNKVKGAPILVCQDHLADGKARAVLCNSGNANTCAPNGVEVATESCALVAAELGISVKDVIVASTGVIGEPLFIAPFEKAIPKAVSKLSYDGSDEAAQAIMTTDTVKKEVAVSFVLGGKECHIGGIAKGSGMINPNMATMLCFITTDVAINSDMLNKALLNDIQDTFNQISIDGDTSTNDTVAILANGLAGNKEIDSENEDFKTFCQALHHVNEKLSRGIAKDGEGATKLVECTVSGVENKELARRIAKTVISSDLVKTAIFGADANWGRVLCAIGYTPDDFNVENVNVTLSSSKGSIEVCKDSEAVPFSEDMAKKILAEDEIKILVNMNQGDFSAVAFGCDLTYDYVKINGDYRT